jgi:3-oxoacyl-(acyl-carrier-protein) synthase/thioesterase domain-containing protein
VRAVIAWQADAIALVGMAGRLPDAAGPDAFWGNTLRGRSSVLRRTNASGTVLWARGELADITSFDPAFFGMSPRAALLLDPQHRMLLECAWEALADAAADSQKPIRRTAVVASANYSGYRELLEQAGVRASAVEFDSGTDKDFLATTIAYRLGLEGPCLTVQTACSSSLVAVHLACQALLECDADQALAGGVSIVLPHTPGWRFEPRGIHSDDGVCRPFDADANGTVMGDGAGVVVLRRLEDAIADGCRIYAVLRGSAVNNDGARKIGYAAPSPSGQADVIRAAQARAEVAPGGITYIEAHGTGTPLGDRVEFEALADVFRAGGAGDSRCAIGSAKGAIGHLDVAAGVASLMRASLALYHAVLPGTVNHHRLHPELLANQTLFYVPRTPVQWSCAGPRRAGVSSFGVGGTNAHIVLEEWVPQTRPVTAKPETLAGRGYQRGRYWPAPATAHPAVQPGAGSAAVPVEYRRSVWREWAAGERRPDRPGYSRIILLADPDTTGDALHELLRATDHDVERPGAWPNGALAAAATTPGRKLLVCAWALSDPGRALRAYDALTTVAACWLSGAARPGGLDVVLLTRGVYPVTGEEDGDPALATLSGLARVVSMEAPAVRARVLDLQRVDLPALEGAVLEALAWHGEPVLAQRGRRWWLPAFEPVTATALRPYPNEVPCGLGACVVIGAGTVGVAAAGVLARTGRTVVVAARPGPGAERAAALARDLESAPVAVLPESCDAADPDQIDALLRRVASRFGAIDQVVLAAGISGDAAYQPSAALPGWEDETHVAVKVGGVAALGAACDRYGVRRTVLMSSLAGVLGAIALGPYSAAAAAMDCYALHFSGSSAAWLSVGWDAWQHDDASASAHEQAMVRDGLSVAEAEAALSDVLLSDAAGHLLVVKRDFELRWDRFVRQPLVHESADPKPLTGAAPAPEAGVPQIVLDAWRVYLADPTLELDDDLSARGADSLSSIDVLASLGVQFGVPLPTDLIFQARTPRLFAADIVRMLTDSGEGAGQLAVRHWHSDGPMVWCIHPVSGSADCFGPLAALLGGYQLRAVAGLQLADVGGEESIENQARRYHDLLAASGRPPAVLLGWSYGGILAFETAQVVFAMTGRAPVVILVDIPAPAGAGRRSIAKVSDAEIMLAISSNRARETGREPAAAIAAIALLSSSAESADDADGHALACVLDRLQADGLLPPAFTAELAARVADGYRRRIGAAEQYRPTPYPGRLILLRANEPEFGDGGVLEGVLPAPANDPTWGWAALAGGGCIRQILDGHHATLLQPPSVSAVALAVRLAASAGEGA